MGMTTGVIALTLCLPAWELSQVNLVSSDDIPFLTDEAKGKQWFRLTTTRSNKEESFEVLALDKTHCERIHKNIENVKAWTLQRWGLKNIEFSQKCMVICVPSKEVYAKFFGKQEPTYRIEEGRSIIWTYFEGRQDIHTIPPLLTEICLSEYEKQNNVKLGLWSHRGMSILNGNIPSIRESLKITNDICKNNKECYWFDDLMKMSFKQYSNENERDRTVFDSESAVVCLMLIKEYGQNKFASFLNLSREDPSKALKSVYGLTPEQFDSALKTYMTRISADAISGAAPDSYFTWTFRRR